MAQIDTDAKVLGESAFGFGQNHILKIGSRYYAAHVNESNYIEVHYSDNGTDWTLNYTSAVTVGDGHLSMCSSELGDVFLCFVSGTSSPYLVKVIRRDHTAGTWSEVLSQSQASTNDKTYALCHYNRNINRLHVFWTRSDTALNFTYVYNSYSDNYGTGWTSGTSFNNAGKGITYMYGLDSKPSTGVLYLLWVGVGCSFRRTEIFSAVGVETGSEGDFGVNTVYGGGLVIDSAGNRYSVGYYFSTPNYILQVKKNGVDELTIYSDTVDVYKQGMFSIGIDAADNVYIYYVKESDGKIYMRKYNGAAWEDEAAVTDAVSYRPSLEHHSPSASNKVNFVYYTD